MTRYTTTIEADCWHYPGHGDIPREAREALDKNGWWNHVTAPIDLLRDDVGRAYPSDQTHHDYLMWFGCGGNQRCHAGYWIVQSDYGLEAVHPEAFAAYCRRVDDTEGGAS